MEFDPSWKFYAESFSGRFFYDSENIGYPSKKVVRLRNVLFYSEEAKQSIKENIHKKIEVPSKDWNYVDCAIFLTEIDCSNKMHRTLSVSYYTNKRIKFHEVKTPSHEAGWFPIEKGSTAEGLYEVLCKRKFWKLC
jgi:hypothetical protein